MTALTSAAVGRGSRASFSSTPCSSDRSRASSSVASNSALRNRSITRRSFHCKKLSNATSTRVVRIRSSAVGSGRLRRFPSGRFGLRFGFFDASARRALRIARFSSRRSSVPEPSASKRCSRRRTLALDGGGSSSSLAMIAATSHVSSSPSLDASYSDRNKSTMRKSSRCMCASSDRSTVLTIASTSASVGGGGFLPLPPAALGGELDRCRVRGGMVRAAVGGWRMGLSVMLHVVRRLRALLLLYGSSEGRAVCFLRQPVGRGRAGA